MFLVPNKEREVAHEHITPGGGNGRASCKGHTPSDEYFVSRNLGRATVYYSCIPTFLKEEGE
jgi:hypothetical protein